MKHAREDYNERIQDTAGLIPKDEPVFLLRGQDILAPQLVATWAHRARVAGCSLEIVEAAEEQAEAMRAWQIKKAAKIPDLPQGA